MGGRAESPGRPEGGYRNGASKRVWTTQARRRQAAMAAPGSKGKEVGFVKTMGGCRNTADLGAKAVNKDLSNYYIWKDGFRRGKRRITGQAQENERWDEAMGKTSSRKSVK